MGQPEDVYDSIPISQNMWSRGPVVSAVEAAAADYRYHYRLSPTPGEWYVQLPNWVVYQGGRTIEQFAAEFERSVKRMVGLPLGNLVGFETDAPGGVYRYRLSWLAPEDPETPQEDPL